MSGKGPKLGENKARNRKIALPQFPAVFMEEIPSDIGFCKSGLRQYPAVFMEEIPSDIGFCKSGLPQFGPIFEVILTVNDGMSGCRYLRSDRRTSKHFTQETNKNLRW